MSMPAGKYVIGDLCYFLNDAWDEFCVTTIQNDRVIDGEFTLSDGRRFASYATMYGDGQYPCSEGQYLSVDAGLIGCILLSDIKDVDALDNVDRLGCVVDFEDEFDTECREDGTITFGHVNIFTGSITNDDEDEYSERDC